ncbi:unnamed protein product [Sphagnum troendelagicum]
MLISEMEDQLHTFDYIEGFVVMNNQDPINGLKSVPFSPDADQAVSGMSSNMLPTVVASSVLYYLEATVGYNLVDVESLEDVGSFALHPVALVQHGRLLLQVSEPGPRCGAELACTATVGRVAPLARHVHPCVFHDHFRLLGVLAACSCGVRRTHSRLSSEPKQVFEQVNHGRWDRRTAAMVPDEEVFYLVAFLRDALPSGPGLESMLDENARILRVCEDLNGKHYLPKYTEEEQWKQHFGCEKWTAFVQHKHMFDPHAILAPGQNMFRRNQKPPGLDQLLLLRSDSASS